MRVGCDDGRRFNKKQTPRICDTLGSVTATPRGRSYPGVAATRPTALRGALWYQGESNAERANEYRALFGAMITSWRAHFGQGDFPFYWVSLANYGVPPDATGLT